MQSIHAVLYDGTMHSHPSRIRRIMMMMMSDEIGKLPEAAQKCVGVALEHSLQRFTREKKEKEKEKEEMSQPCWAWPGGCARPRDCLTNVTGP